MSRGDDTSAVSNQRALWRAQLYAGQAAYLGVGVALAIYFVITWNSAPHRLLMALITVAAAVPMPLAIAYARELVASKYRQPVFIAWNIGCYLLILVLSVLDGGISSPIALLWYLPTIYLMFGYSQRAVMLCAPLGMLMYLLSAWLTPSPFPYTLFVLQLILLADSLMLVSLGVISSHRRDRKTAALQRRLAVLASTDDLTGCLNRRALMESVAMEVRSAARHRQSVSMLMIDVDRFKGINDNHGHMAGDDVLRRLGSSLRRAVDERAWVGRVGGDEFSVVCRDIGSEAAIALARRLLETTHLLGRNPQVSVSIGVCTLSGADLSEGSLQEAADSALYTAKTQGRNQFAVYAESSPRAAAMPRRVAAR